MKKKSILLLGLVATFGSLSAQNISSKKWSDLFSYNNVFAIKEGDGKLIAATNSGIFYYNVSSGEISKLSKSNGLHEVNITAFDYDPTTKVGLVGYNSGALDVITPDGVTYVVDIPIAASYTGNKKINHISVSDGKAVISSGYGVSLFNLTKKEFITSAFFGSGGVYEASKEATLFNGKLYAVTATGLKSHDLGNTFPIYTSWTNEMPGNFTQISAKGDLIFSNSNQVYRYNGGAITPVTQTFTAINDLVEGGSNIYVTDANKVYTLTSNGSPVSNFDFEEICNTGAVVGGKLFAGTKKSGIKNEQKNVFKPDGPYYNYAYKINVLDNNQLLVSTGARGDEFSSPTIIPDNPGFYYYNGSEWIYSSFFLNSTNGPFNVLDVVKNPNNENEFFMTNFMAGSGLTSNGVYKLKYNPTSKDIEFVKKYNLNSIDLNWYSRPVGFTNDDQGNLFVTISFAAVAEWYGLGVYDKAVDDFKINYPTIPTTGAQKPLFKDGLLWLPLVRGNFFAAIDLNGSALNFSDDKLYLIKGDNGLPASGFTSQSFALDKNGDGWIGTDKGVRVLSNAASEIRNNPQVEPIIIEQNGLGEELFRDTSILQIETDEGNNKWVSTEGGGVYYLSPDGQRVIKHFTKENSPLPNNEVTDIKVDRKTGKVYFATYEGIVVYQGDIGEVTSNFGNVLVYPNPVVRNNFKGNVTIKGLAEKTNIRITDAAGNLVHSAVANGGVYEWNLNNLRGTRVASGIYFVLMTNGDGSDKATAKIAVVN